MAHGGLAGGWPLLGHGEQPQWGRGGPYRSCIAVRAYLWGTARLSGLLARAGRRHGADLATLVVGAAICYNRLTLQRSVEGVPNGEVRDRAGLQHCDPVDGGGPPQQFWGVD